MSKYKTISISEETFKEFERMAQAYGLTNKGLIETMLLYFKASKADPRDPKSDNPTDAIKALARSIKDESSSIKAFIKQQEKVTLTPIKENVLEINSILSIFKNTEEDTGIMRRRQGRSLRTYLKAIHRHFQIIIIDADKD